MMDPPQRKFTMAPTATVAEAPILAAFGAEAMKTEATATSCTAGIRVGGWRITTVHGSIFGEAEVEAFTERLCGLAGCTVQLPEMPYTSSLELLHESSGKRIRFAAEHALEAWARQQRTFRADLLAASSKAAAGEEGDLTGAGGGMASVVKVGASASWTSNAIATAAAAATAAAGGGAGGSVSSTSPVGGGPPAPPSAAAAAVVAEGDEHDWTFFTDWAGAVVAADDGDGAGGVGTSQKSGEAGVGGDDGVKEEGAATAAAWESMDRSGINMGMLTDTSVPILFFDEVALYEDELHDFGDMSLTCKLRVMPGCWFLLVRCWCRVDGVEMRAAETRLFANFSEGNGDVVHRDVSERRCSWSDLKPKLGLSSDPRDHRDPNKTVPRLPLVLPPPSSHPTGGATGRAKAVSARLVLGSGAGGSASGAGGGAGGSAGGGGGVPAVETNQGQRGGGACAGAGAAADLTLSSSTSLSFSSSASLSSSASSMEAAAAAFKGVVWTAPVRRIFNESSDMGPWLSSPTHAELMRFVKLLAHAVQGQPVANFATSAIAGGTGSWSGGVKRMVALLDTLETLIQDVPPVKQPMRFGNRAFSDWHSKVVGLAPSLLKALALAHDGDDGLLGNFEEELAPYLTGAFGDPTRIDYGTGHETCFLSLLLCLGRLGVFLPSDAPQLVSVVFARYMKVMRALQRTYILEPAGSHGVWGLDDYHCLPFVFGAAQLMGLAEQQKQNQKQNQNQKIQLEKGGASSTATAGSAEAAAQEEEAAALGSPCCVDNDGTLRRFSPTLMKAASPSSTTSGCASGVAGAGADGGVGGATGGGGGGSEVGASGGRWLYLDGVATVRAVKWTAPFSETSPMLHALAMLPQWRQVFVGLMKHYEAEVLGKFPVIQHFKFGRLLPATWTATATATNSNANTDVGTTAMPPPGPVSPPPIGLDVAPWAVSSKAP